MPETDPLKTLIHSLHLDGEPGIEGSGEQQFEEFAQFINHLISTDFSRLLNILYRVDVEEKKVKAALADNDNDAGKSAGHIIAALLVERQVEKIKVREEYRKYKSG